MPTDGNRNTYALHQWVLQVGNNILTMHLTFTYLIGVAAKIEIPRK